MRRVRNKILRVQRRKRYENESRTTPSPFISPQLSSNPLSVENAGECLSMLCKTGDGLAHAYANLDIKDRFVRAR